MDGTEPASLRLVPEPEAYATGMGLSLAWKATAILSSRAEVIPWPLAGLHPLRSLAVR